MSKNNNLPSVEYVQGLDKGKVYVAHIYIDDKTMPVDVALQYAKAIDGIFKASGIEVVPLIERNGVRIDITGDN